MRRKFSAIVLGAAMSVAGASHASLTTIQAPPSREANQAQILSHFYGGTFVASGNDFSNGSLTAVRLNDSGGDTNFTGGDYTVTTIAKFADRNEGFGYVPGTTGGSYQKLFEVSGSNYGASGSATVNTGSGDFRWAMNGNSATYTTDAANNAGGKDAVVTYKVEGTADNLTHYALFWENLNADEPASVKTRNDYNDLAVDVASGADVSSASSGGNSVPLPAAIWPGGAMLAGLLFYRGRRKIRGVLE